MFKRIVAMKIWWLAKLIIKRYQPLVIGITGSVGKTSAKEAVYSVLRGTFSPRKNEKNFNNEFGVPLTVIGSRESAGRSFFAWLAIILQGWKVLLWSHDYPKVLILEMGADRQGDISALVSLTRPKIGILTAIGASHLEYFKTLENIVKEKSQLILGLPKDGTAIMNFDDPMLAGVIGKASCKVLTFGYHDDADIRAEQYHLAEFEGRIGSSFKVNYQGNSIPAFLPDALGKQQTYAALAAIATAIATEISLFDAVQRLFQYQAPPGRTHIINGIKQSIIIDDTYNASPQSTIAALALLKDVQELKKCTETYAVLGAMLELGTYAESGHIEVGRAAFQSGVNNLVAVGQLAKKIAQGARETGMPERQIFYFEDTVSAGKFIQAKMQANSLLLIKGSQGARMELIVKELMSDPLHAPELLVRQGKEWAR